MSDSYISACPIVLFAEADSKGISLIWQSLVMIVRQMFCGAQKQAERLALLTLI